jgi:peptidoglycan hydrolase-like protein with peptidoglycan-binding domain
MNRTFTLKSEGVSVRDRVLVLLITGALAVCMLFLAFTASAATLTRQLDIGAKGTDVSDLQAFLARDTSIYPSGLVTGYYGSLTAAAVAKFQTKNGLASVGRVGPQTLALINTRMGSGSTGPGGVLPITNVSVNTTSSSMPILSWNTSGNTSSVIYYSTSPLVMTESSPTSGVVISGSSMIGNSDYTTAHQASVAGLASSTTYNYVIYTRDAAGNENITWPTTFRTQ